MADKLQLFKAAAIETLKTDKTLILLYGLFSGVGGVGFGDSVGSVDHVGDFLFFAVPMMPAMTLFIANLKYGRLKRAQANPLLRNG